MLRLLATALLASSIALSGTAVAGTSDNEVTAPDDCATVTFVKSEGVALAVDLYVTKASWSSTLPDDPTELGTLLEEVAEDVGAAVIEKMENGALERGIVHVEAVLPRNDDTAMDGYRFSFIVKTWSCAG